MAVTFVNTVGNHFNSKTTFTVATTPSGADRLIICSLATKNAITSVEYDGNPMTELFVKDEGTVEISTYYYVAPAADVSKDVIAIFGSTNGAMYVTAFAGVHQTDPIYHVGHFKANSTSTPSISLFNPVENGLIMDFLCRDGQGTNTEGADQTQRIEHMGTNPSLVGSTQDPADGGIMSHSFSGATDVAHVAVVLNPATGSSDGVPVEHLFTEGDGWNGTSTMPAREVYGGGENRLLIVNVAYRDNRTITALDYDGNPMTLIVEDATSNTAVRASMYYYIGPVKEKKLVTGSMNSSCSGEIIASVFKGVHQTDPHELTDKDYSAATTSVSSTVASTDNGLWLDCVARFIQNTFVEGAGQTSLAEQNNTNPSLGVSTKPVNGDVTMGWSWTSNSIAVHLMTMLNSHVVGGAARGNSFFFSMAGLAIPAATIASLYKEGAVAL